MFASGKIERFGKIGGFTSVKVLGTSGRRKIFIIASILSYFNCPRSGSNASYTLSTVSQLEIEVIAQVAGFKVGWKRCTVIREIRVSNLNVWLEDNHWICWVIKFLTRGLRNNNFAKALVSTAFFRLLSASAKYSEIALAQSWNISVFFLFFFLFFPSF